MPKTGPEPSTVLITGASGGIGLELAKVFARSGHDLVLVARSEDKLDALAGELGRDHGITTHVIARDLSLEEAAREVFGEVTARGIEIDILVNNAGMIAYGNFHETDYDRERTMIGVNLLALTLLTKLFLPGMVARGSGRILNVGSNGSFAPSPLNAVYSATKAYVLSLSEAIAEELAGTGVTVTALCPGATKSDLQDRAGMEDVRLLQMGLLDPKDVAESGYRGLMAGKRIIVPGLFTKLQVFSIRFMPRRWVVKLAQEMLQRSG